MGMLKSRWEADYQGHRFTVTRTELTRGFKLEYDGRLVDKKSWSLIGVGELDGTIETAGKTVPVHVALGYTRVDFVEGGSLATEGTKVGNGPLVYSSWLTMQQRNESNEDA